MNDPFRPEANQQLLREARIGLTLLAVSLGIFSYVAYHRISGNGTRLPDHVVEAPIAELIWPGENPTQIADRRPAPQGVATQFGGLIASARQSFGMGKNRSSSKTKPGKTTNFEDPVAGKKTDRLPVVKIPVQTDQEPLAFDEMIRKSAKRKTANMFGATRSNKRDRTKLPIDANQLRLPKKAEPDPSSSILPKQPDRLSKQLKQVSSKTVKAATDQATDFEQNTILPQTKADRPTKRNANTSFHAQPLRPVATANDDFTTQDDSNEFAPVASNTNHDKSTEFELNEIDDPANTDTVPHSGSRISSKVITSDIAAEFAGHIVQPESAQDQIQSTTFDQQLQVSVHSGQPTSLQIDETADSSASLHTVSKGESFWSIAQQHYDDGRYFRALYEYNRKRVEKFEDLIVGSKIATPPKLELAKLWPDLCPRNEDSVTRPTDIDDRVYVTRDGDTLFEIARQHLQQASRYLEIFNINQARLPDGVNHLSPLPAGIQLVIPLEESF